MLCTSTWWVVFFFFPVRTSGLGGCVTSIDGADRFIKHEAYDPTNIDDDAIEEHFRYLYVDAPPYLLKPRISIKNLKFPS
jgi:hypothetical protein